LFYQTDLAKYNGEISETDGSTIDSKSQQTLLSVNNMKEEGEEEDEEVGDEEEEEEEEEETQSAISSKYSESTVSNVDTMSKGAASSTSTLMKIIVEEDGSQKSVNNDNSSRQSRPISRSQPSAATSSSSMASNINPLSNSSSYSQTPDVNFNVTIDEYQVTMESSRKPLKESGDQSKGKSKDVSDSNHCRSIVTNEVKFINRDTNVCELQIDSFSNKKTDLDSIKSIKSSAKTKEEEKQKQQKSTSPLSRHPVMNNALHVMERHSQSVYEQSAKVETLKK
jgi:hypothetical protein